jgi:prepilin peptidase CpaA
LSEVLNLNNLIVLALLIAAVVSDLKFKKVENRWILLMLALSLIVQIAAHGTASFGLILSSFATAFVVALPLYLLKVFGGGDFKLLLAVSPLLHWKAIITVIALSFIWGALLGVFRVILAGEGLQLAANMAGIFSRRRPQAASLHSIPFTVAILFGFLSQLTLSQVGWELL